MTRTLDKKLSNKKGRLELYTKVTISGVILELVQNAPFSNKKSSLDQISCFLFLTGVLYRRAKVQEHQFSTTAVSSPLVRKSYKRKKKCSREFTKKKKLCSLRHSLSAGKW